MGALACAGVSKPATEINAGEEARTCSHDASHVETRTIPLTDHEHVLTNVEARAAACENAGNIEYWVCSDGEKPCGLCFSDVAGENVIALSDTVITAGHEWDEGVVTTPKGCTTDGVITYTCKRDASHTRTETIPATGYFGHYEDKTVQITTASCTQAEYSYDVRYCADCGDVPHSHFYKSGNSLGHDWGEWVVTKPATETEAGEEVRTCRHDASHVETRVIPAKGSGEAVEKATLTFDLAGGTLDGKTGIVTVKAAVGETIALPGAPVRDGYTFVCWRGSEYAAGAEYKVEGGHSFTAEWAKNPGGNGKDSSGSSSSSSSSSGRAIPATGDNLNFAAAILAAVALGALIGVAYCAARRKATRGGLGR